MKKLLIAFLFLPVFAYAQQDFDLILKQYRVGGGAREVLVPAEANKLLGFDTNLKPVLLDAASGAGDMLKTDNLSGLADVATARINLGLAIGTNVQAYDADLALWAALVPSAKQDALGFTAVPSTRTVNGQALSSDATISSLGGVGDSASTFGNIPASTTAKSSLRLAHGAAPTSPVNGDVWTTTAGVYARINGATVGPFGAGGGAGDVTAAANFGTDGLLIVSDGTLKGIKAATTLAALSITNLTITNITGTVGVANGGTGATTLTGILKGNGTSAVTAVTAPSGTIVGTTDTQTLTNKRITARVASIGSGATPTINTDNYDCVNITGLAVDITSMTTNLTGTPAEFDQLEFRITGTAARAITWGAKFLAGPTALPTTTVTTKALHVWFEWDTVRAAWICMSSGSDA